MFVLIRIQCNFGSAMIISKVYPKEGLAYTGHRRTLSIESNGILSKKSGKDADKRQFQIDCSFEDM